MIDGFADKDYNDRLKELGLTTLVTRSKTGGLIEAFKIIKGFEDAISDFFPLAINIAHIRGHNFKKIEREVKHNVRKNFFIQRFFNDRNIFP